MARFYNDTTHVVVSVADEKADRFTSGWTELADGEYAPAPSGDGQPKSAHAGKNVPDLKAEIERRNEGRDDADKLPVDGKKAELVSALDADDAKANGND